MKIITTLSLCILLVGCSYGVHAGKKCLVADGGTAWSYVWFAESGAELTECDG